jgi:hypothetical protein
MCGFVGDIVGGVVDAIGSVVEVIIDNALPILETVALTAVLGPAGLGLSKLTATVISRVAVTALNGGSLIDVATAGLTPMLPSIGSALGINLDASGFITKSVGDLLGNGTLANIVAGAIGEGTTAGVMAAITGGDVLKAATMAGLSDVVGKGLSKTWDTAREYIPALAEFQDSIKSGYDKLTGEPETLSTIKTMADLETELTGTAKKYNDILQKYQDTKYIYDIEVDRFNEFKDANDISQANSMAKLINEGSGKTLNDLGNELNSLYGDYDTKNLEFQDFLKTNQATIEYAAPLIQEISNYQSQYDLFDNKIKADYANYAMSESVFKGDFVKASDYLKEYNDANAKIAKLDPDAMVGHDLGNEQLDMLSKIASTTDEATRQQLISQAKLDPVFAEIMSGPAPDYSKIKPIESTPPTTQTPIPVDTTPVTPTTPTTPTPVTPVVPETPPTDERAPGYADLPTLPEDGIGQPAPSVPTTPPNSTLPPSSGGTIGSIGSSIANQVGNIVTNLPNTITNAVTGNLVGQITNEILGGNEPPKRPTINKPRPPAKADVGTLRPYTGSLFGETTTTPTTPTTPVGGLPTTPPAKVDPSSLTPYTGPLSFLGQTTTPPTNTTTQTPSGGLQSTQTQTPPTKVDVSRLTPVTDTNLLKSLGIA